MLWTASLINFVTSMVPLRKEFNPFKKLFGEQVAVKIINLEETYLCEMSRKGRPIKKGKLTGRRARQKRNLPPLSPK